MPPERRREAGPEKRFGLTPRHPSCAAFGSLERTKAPTSITAIVQKVTSTGHRATAPSLKQSSATKEAAGLTRDQMGTLRDGPSGCPVLRSHGDDLSTHRSGAGTLCPIISTETALVTDRACTRPLGRSWRRTAASTTRARARRSLRSCPHPPSNTPGRRRPRARSTACRGRPSAARRGRV